MTRPVFFMPAARQEMVEAQNWYAHEAPGLGQRFRAEVDFQILNIAAHPLRFPVILQDIHRARLRRFPYGLFSCQPRPDDLAKSHCVIN